MATKKAETNVSAFFKKELAATYSRRIYKTTTIGKTVFDGRVRNGNGSDHSFMATKNQRSEIRGREVKNDPGHRRLPNVKEQCRMRRFSENCTQTITGITIRELNRNSQWHREPKFTGTRRKSDQAARPISISPLNGLLRLHA